MGPVALDASALLAYLVDEPAAAEVETVLRSERQATIAAVNIAETADWLIRVGGRSPDEVRQTLDLLLVSGLQVEPLWVPTARMAAELRARHYDRRDAPLSMADCVCLATAVRLAASLATTDRALARTARGLGVDVMALPGSKGDRP
jgi:ribonuclease VapC